MDDDVRNFLWFQYLSNLALNVLRVGELTMVEGRLFHRLTVLLPVLEKKCWRVFFLDVFFFSFHSCPLVRCDCSHSKGIWAFTSSLNYLYTSMRSPRWKR